MSSSEDFMDLFNNKHFEKAQRLFDNLNDETKQSIFAHLFQSSQCKEMPSSVSVLFRRLHEGQEFSDFYTEVERVFFFFVRE